MSKENKNDLSANESSARVKVISSGNMDELGREDEKLIDPTGDQTATDVLEGSENDTITKPVVGNKDLLDDDTLPGDKILSGGDDVLTNDHGLADDQHLMEEDEDENASDDEDKEEDDDLGNDISLGDTLSAKEEDSEVLPVDKLIAGGDLDVPGTELDDEEEKTGNEDEENNYYSIGGDSHENLEEDR